MEIRRYQLSDETNLFAMLREEGPEWEGYWGEDNQEKYKAALKSSVVFVAYEGEQLCGYARCREDNGYGIYVYDLLVRKQSRGRHIGRALMETARDTYPNAPAYVLGDVPEYYENKLGYRVEGTVYIIG
ncbi:MAG: GNAT family N-acetyltransferase [Clostridiales bacterium]|nr:GNAT family N-acetyltransferase [Clostridiales bacterium]